MARMSPAEKQERISAVIDAWRRLAPDASFSRMSLAQFIAAVKPSLDVREEIDRLESQLRIALERRDSADDRSLALISLVGSAVKGDPYFGRNSYLCKAMGYTRETDRRRKIRQGKRRRAKQAAKR